MFGSCGLSVRFLWKQLGFINGEKFWALALIKNIACISSQSWSPSTGTRSKGTVSRLRRDTFWSSIEFLTGGWKRRLRQGQPCWFTTRFSAAPSIGSSWAQTSPSVRHSLDLCLTSLSDPSLLSMPVFIYSLLCPLYIYHHGQMFERYWLHTSGPRIGQSG